MSGGASEAGGVKPRPYDGERGDLASQAAEVEPRPEDRERVGAEGRRGSGVGAGLAPARP